MLVARASGDGRRVLAAPRGGKWWPRRRLLLLRLGALLLLWPPLAAGLARALVAGDELARADALVVLSGASTHAERARRAAQLFGEGRAPGVLLTNDGQRGGWSSAEQRNPFSYEGAARELRAAGVPAARIEVLPSAVSSTYEEAVALREFARARGLRSLLVVTSAYHSRRASWVMQKVFQGSGVAVGMAAVAPGDQTPTPLTWWLHPRGWEMVAGEYVKLAYYRLCYS